MGPKGPNDSTLFIRRKENSVSLGSISPPKDGAPYDEIVKLKYIEENTYEVETIALNKNGPSMVNSERFKNNWNTIFGRQTIGEA